MTEQEWVTLDAFTSRHWVSLGEFLPPRFTRRHAYRAAAASWPLVAHLFTDRRVQDAARYVDRLADGAASWSEREFHLRTLQLVEEELWEQPGRMPMADPEGYALQAVRWALRGRPFEIAFALMWCADALHRKTGSDFAIASRPFTHILRDVAGNPFRRPRFDWHWPTATVVGLARAIHADRAFDRMPILADALEEAGCDDADILTHCRDADGTHVRGCWVLDPILDHG